MWSDILSKRGLDCADDGGAGCAGDRAQCRRNAGQYLGQRWDICPIRSIIDDPYVQAVALLEAGSKLNPLTGWPDDFAAWVQPLWTTLRTLMSDRQAHALEQAKGARNG